MLRLLVAFALVISSTLLSVGQAQPSRALLPTRIRNVEYRPHVYLHLHDKVETSRSLRNNVNDRATPYGTDEVRAIALEYAHSLLRDHGYWKALVKAKLIPQLKQGRTQWFDLIFEIEEGPRYYVSDIKWVGMKEFTEAELSKTMIRPGDVASRRRIAHGLESLCTLYHSRGFIDCTSFPDSMFDDQAHTLALLIHVDEGGQFRFRDLSLPGLDEAHREMILRRWESLRGTPYSREKEEEFFRRVLWPTDPRLRKLDYSFYREFVSMDIDQTEQAADFSIRFVPPPQVANVR